MFECRGAQYVRRAPTPVYAHRDGAKKKSLAPPPLARCGGLGVREPGWDVEGGAWPKKFGNPCTRLMHWLFVAYWAPQFQGILSDQLILFLG